VSIALEDLREQAMELKEATGLNLMPTLSRLERTHDCPAGMLRL
jgi:spermidine synthase